MPIRRCGDAGGGCTHAHGGTYTRTHLHTRSLTQAQPHWRTAPPPPLSPPCTRNTRARPSPAHTRTPSIRAGLLPGTLTLLGLALRTLRWISSRSRQMDSMALWAAIRTVPPGVSYTPAGAGAAHVRVRAGAGARHLRTQLQLHHVGTEWSSNKLAAAPEGHRHVALAVGGGRKGGLRAALRHLCRLQSCTPSGCLTHASCLMPPPRTEAGTHAGGAPTS